MTLQVMIGYDGSPAANAAVNAGAALFPQAHAWVVHVWTPPFASAALRRRLRATAGSVDELVDSIEREGQREADAIAAAGVAIATAAGWHAEPLVKHTYGGEGLRLAQLAEKLQSDVLIVGARGLHGTDAVLGGVANLVVHYATVPVLVIPHPLLADEFAALSCGTIVVGYDASAGSTQALDAARHLFPGRRFVPAQVLQDGADDPADALLPAAEDVVRLRPPGRPVFGARSAADALVACADAQDAAILVVGSRGHSAVREALLGSVAMTAVHRSTRPVLVVPG